MAEHRSSLPAPESLLSRGLRRARCVIDPIRGRLARRHALVGPAHLWRKKRAFQIDFLRLHGLAPGHRVLDVGCGTLRGGIPVIETLEPGGYVGLDVREQALEEGRREIGERGLWHKRPELVRSDHLAGLDVGHGSFDFAWAFFVLIHMPDAIVADCIAAVSRHLRPGGRFFANVHLEPREQDGRWREFPVCFRSFDFYRDLAEQSGLRVERLGTMPELDHRCGNGGDATSMLELTRTA